jgi:hypothetical protein
MINEHSESRPEGRPWVQSDTDKTLVVLQKYFDGVKEADSAWHVPEIKVLP